MTSLLPEKDAVSSSGRDTFYRQLRQAKIHAQVASNRFAAYFEQAPAAYFTLDIRARIRELNLMAASLLGINPQEQANADFRYFLHESSLETFDQFLKEVFLSKTRQECEVRLLPASGQGIYVQLQGVLSRGENICLLNALDITSHRQAQQILVESESRLRELNTTKDKFFSIISHDLKGPFSSIIGLSNLLLNKVREAEYEEVEEYAEYIQLSSTRAMDLLNNLLQWSRAQTGKIHFAPRTTDLGMLTHEVKNLLWNAALQKSIYIDDRIPRETIIWADETMISTVLRNLISNAIKFTRSGGRITLMAEKHPGELHIMVRDNGVGISQNLRERLFHIDRGHTSLGTRNEMGTGLGLMLCKEFIAMHGGNIWVESVPDKGSTFFFTIPDKEE